ncbi:glycoside hydrolase family 108 protein [Mesorhizobium sp. CAU 1732]|uniref:glycoside hydrolase family 108 protein n=1 Tax=Mesorhizobium sp. CAU 1732 TaxID=3140358 RepID=UPI0032613F15
MARETLPAALALMFGHEGGYVNAKTDAGGPTKYGITHRTLAAHRGVTSVTAAQVKALTLKEAETIYRKSYWTQSGGDLLPAGLDYAAFDYGVNSGPARAIKSLQAVVGVPQDGIVGGQTVAAVNRYPGGVTAVIRAYCGERMRFLRSLGGARGFPANGRGWTIRVTGKDPKGQWKDEPGVIGNALRLAAGATPAPSPAPVAGGKANPADRSITDIVKEEPSLVVSILGGLGTIAAGTGPLQWALAIGVVAAVGYGLYRLVKRERANA